MENPQRKPQTVYRETIDIIRRFVTRAGVVSRIPHPLPIAANDDGPAEQAFHSKSGILKTKDAQAVIKKYPAPSPKNWWIP